MTTAATAHDSTTFNISTNDAAYRRALAPIFWCLRLVGPILTVAGLWFFLADMAPIRWAGIGLLGLAAYGYWGATQTLTPGAKTLEVGVDGLTVHRPGRAPITILYDDPNVQLAVVDYRPSGDPRRNAPWCIATRKQSVGVSDECAAAVIAVARAKGLKEDVSGAGVAGMAPRAHRFRR